MTQALAIAARELRERWILFPAALAFGVLPVVLPAFGPAFRDIAPVVGVAFAVVLGAAAAVVIGSTMLARDAAEGRLAFLLARPVSLASVWAGKWIAALVLVLGSGLLAAVPWMAVTTPPEAHGGSWLSALANGPGTMMFLGLAVLAVGIANFNAAAFRSRSAWLALDLALLVAAVLVLRRYLPPFAEYGLLDALIEVDAIHLPSLVVWILALAGLVGSAAQLAQGRTDLRRAHRALSTASWLVLWTAIAGVVGAVAWVRAAPPSELSAWMITGSAGARWAHVLGSARAPRFPHVTRSWPQSAYLIDSRTGRYLRLPDGTTFWPLRFSEDGRIAVQLQPDEDERGTAVRIFSLEGDAPRSTLVAMEKSPPFESWGADFALAPSGKLLLYVHSSGASFFELPSGRRVATATVPPGFRPTAARFTGATTARAWLVPQSLQRRELLVFDLALDGRSSSRTFAAGPFGYSSSNVSVDASGTQLLTFDAGIQLRDAADGRLVANLVDTGSDVPRRGGLLAGRILSDGQVVTMEGAPLDGARGPRVTVFGPDGTKRHEATIDAGITGLEVGPELPGGRVILAFAARRAQAETHSLVFDTGTGAVVQGLAGLQPSRAANWGHEAPALPPDPVQLFTDEQGRLLRIDTTTGSREVVAGPGAPAGERLKLD